MAREPGDIDIAKVLKIPFLWKGEKNKWKTWSVKIRGYVAGISMKLRKMMEVAERHGHAINNHEGWEDEQIRLDGKLYSMLTSLTEDDALDIVENHEEGYGL